jgi:hypothetical protein
VRLPVLPLQEIGLAVAPACLPVPFRAALSPFGGVFPRFSACVHTPGPLVVNVYSISVADTHKSPFLPLTVIVEHDLMCFLKEY